LSYWGALVVSKKPVRESSRRIQSRPLPVFSWRSRRIASARVANSSEWTSRHGPLWRFVCSVRRKLGSLCCATRRARSDVWPTYVFPSGLSSTYTWYAIIRCRLTASIALPR